MSGLEALGVRPELRPPTVVPTFWCVTCQLSLRNEDERLVHAKLFPNHPLRTVKRLVCPRCGNNVLLENGALTEHWTGTGSNVRRCSGSGRKP